MNFLGLLWAALREIFDEAAYDRFLASHSHRNTRESYRMFLEERRSAQERKPRCC